MGCQTLAARSQPNLAFDVAKPFTLTGLSIPRYVRRHGIYYRASLRPANVLPFRAATLCKSFSVSKEKS